MTEFEIKVVEVAVPQPIVVALHGFEIRGFPAHVVPGPVPQRVRVDTDLAPPIRKVNVGTPGPEGAKGEMGDRGATGATGARGEVGEKGDPGTLTLWQDDFIVSSEIMSAANYVLSYLPIFPERMQLLVYGGIEQRFGVDYAVSDRLVSWRGLALEALLDAGSVVTIRYQIA